ncbi:MAG TPA: hypothetical protein VFI56_20670 [Vicinamibacterales bacterium]|nr:hypothetical protein [Vicinamibacterales bacterium]
MALLLPVGAAGCISAPARTCEWTAEASVALDLSDSAQRRHLEGDARAAEERAIRYADTTSGHRSGHYQGVAEYHDTREACLAALTREIASRHQLQPVQVADAVGRRDRRLDAIVLIVFAVLFVAAASRLSGGLLSRFAPDQRWPAAIGIAASAVFLSAAAVMIGDLGAATVEMIQLGDMHLSYRAARIPWNRQWPELFVGGVLLFVAIAIVRWRRLFAAGGEQSDGCTRM